MSAIPNESIVTYQGTWPSGTLTPPDTVVSTVASNLSAAGLAIRSQSNTGGFFQNTFGSGGTFKVTLQLQVENGLGFGSPDDIISIIRHYVYDEVGQFPSSDTIPYIQRPGQTQTSTGQPGDNNAAQKGCQSGSSKDLQGNFDLTCWFKNLTTTGFASVGVLALLAVLGIGIFIFAFGLPAGRQGG